MANNENHVTFLRVGGAHAPSEALVRLQQELEVALDRIGELYACLAENSDPGGEAETELLDQLRERDRIALAIGGLAVSSVAAGHRLQFAQSGVTEELVTVVVAEATAPPAAAPSAQAAPVAARVAKPAAKPEVEEVPKGPPANASALMALAQGGLAPTWSQERSVNEQRQALAEIVERIGRPVRPKTLGQLHSVIESLVGTTARLDAWVSQPKTAQRALTGLVAAIARHVQDESKRPPTADDAAELRMVFSRMTRWSKEHEPGFVAGLSRKNGPDSQSWIDDARIWYGELQEMQGPAVVAEGPSPEDALSELEQALGGAATAHEVQTSVKHALESGLTQSDPRLVALLTPHQSMLKGAGGLKTLKSQLREAERADDERQDSEDSASPVADDWAWLDRTRGKHAVILGGDPRPQAVRRIKDAFGFASVTWEELDPRRVSAVGQRVRRGSVDVVILLRSFLSHKVQDAIQPACKESQTPVCLVDTGYGVTQVQRAIERDL